MSTKLDKEHVVAKCPALAFERDSLGISEYLGLSHRVNVSHQFKDYLGGDNAPVSTMIRRGNIIHNMISDYYMVAVCRDSRLYYQPGDQSRDPKGGWPFDARLGFLSLSSAGGITWENLPCPAGWDLAVWGSRLGGLFIISFIIIIIK